MKQLVQRSTAADFEVAGRTIEGVALRLERASRVTDDQWRTSYYEGWRSGAFSKSLTEGTTWPLDRQHDGKAVGLVRFDVSPVERALTFTAVINESDAGDKMLADIESGDWRDTSISAYTLRSATAREDGIGPVLWRIEGKLDSLAIARTGTGLHKGAEVHTLRAVQVETPRLIALRKQLRLL